MAINLLTISQVDLGTDADVVEFHHGFLFGVVVGLIGLVLNSFKLMGHCF